MVIRSRGVSLVELLVGLALSSVLLTGIVTLFSATSSDLLVMGRQIQSIEDRGIINWQMQRRLSLPNVRVYQLSGDPVDAHARAVGVFPGSCADRSTGGICDHGTSLEFASLNTGSGLTIRAYCWNRVAQSLITDAAVDALIAEPMDTTGILGLLSPPNVSAWGLVESRGITLSDPVSGAPLAPDCASSLPRINGRIDPTLYREVFVSPLSAAPGSPAASPADQIALNSSFPNRVVRLNVESIGLMPALTGGGNGGQLQVRSCGFGNGAMTCKGSIQASVDRVGEAFVFEHFAIPPAAFPAATRFQITGGPVARSKACVSPSCESIPNGAPRAVPFRLAGETLLNLNTSGYSLLKQDGLDRIDYAYVTTDGVAHWLQFTMD